jgi:hypothetical protein
MHVIGHDHKRMKRVLVESRFSLAKSLDDLGSDDWISQPKRPGRSLVEGGVQDLEAAAWRDFGGTDTHGCAGLLYDRGREGIVESPSKKDRRILGMPVWEITAVEGQGGFLSIKV